MPHPASSLECLESRIAPAAVFVFTDVDGDRVTIKTSKGSRADLESVLSFEDPGEPGFSLLQSINLAARGDIFNRTDITIFARRTALGGDGHVNVGHIDAAGIDLGRVAIDGDLGQIDAGNAIDPGERDAHPAIKSLRVQSMGRLGTSTQAPGGDLTSTIEGRIRVFHVAGDILGAEIDVPIGGIRVIEIGGFVIGDSVRYSGSIFCHEGRVGSLMVRGSIVGGDADSSGRIDAESFGNATVGGSVIGGSGFGSGRIAFFSDRSIGELRIRGDLIGGAGDQSGMVTSGGILHRLVIGGSIRGGVGPSSGAIAADVAVWRLHIDGDLVGGEGRGSGRVFADRLGFTKISGSVFGGAGQESGSIFAGTRIGHLAISDSVHGSAANFSGVIQAGRIGLLTVGDSVWGGSIRTDEAIRRIVVRGDIVGTENDPVRIVASDFNHPGGPNHLAIAALHVRGRVEWTDVLAGYGAFGNHPAPEGLFTPQASIGRVVVGDWIASNLVAGVQDDADAIRDDDFGDADDSTFVRPGFKPGHIGSVVIRHAALGLPGSGRTFGIVAPEIDSFRIGRTAFKFTAGPGSDLEGYEVGGGTGLFVREVEDQAI